MHYLKAMDIHPSEFKKGLIARAITTMKGGYDVIVEVVKVIYTGENDNPDYIAVFSDKPGEALKSNFGNANDYSSIVPANIGGMVDTIEDMLDYYDEEDGV